jgi:hypothetical protein
MSFKPWYKGSRAHDHIERAFDDLAAAESGQSARFLDSLVDGLSALDIETPDPEVLTALADVYDALATG